MNIDKLYELFKEWRSVYIRYYYTSKISSDPSLTFDLIHNASIKSVNMKNKDNIGDIDIEFNLYFYIPIERYDHIQKIIEDRWNMKNQYSIAQYYSDEPLIFTLENYITTPEKMSSQEVFGFYYNFQCSAIIRDNIRTKIKEKIKERIDINRFELMEID